MVPTKSLAKNTDAPVIPLMKPKVLAALAAKAEAENDWALAAKRWTDCIEAFGVQKLWLVRKARALMKGGRLDEAEQVYRQLREGFPQIPTGATGLGWVAFRKKDWEGALHAWSECRGDYPGKDPLGTTLGEIEALINLDRLEEAKVLVRGIEAQYPGNAQLKQLNKTRTRAAVESSRRAGTIAACGAELRGEINRNFPVDGDVDDVINGMLLLTNILDYTAARDRLLSAIPRARTARHFEDLLRTTGKFVEPGSQGAVWDRLLAAVTPLAKEGPDCCLFLSFELRLLLAMERLREFTERYDAVEGELGGTVHAGLLRKVRARLAKSRAEVFAEPKVFCIGLSRTGTTSIAQALNIVGIDTAHWSNPLTYRMLEELDFFLFDGCADSCVAQNFEMLYYQYPNARFVQTTRPLESWVSSISRRFESFYGSGDMQGLRREFGRMDTAGGAAHSALVYGLYFNQPDFARAYEVFDARVRHFFSDKQREKLLTLDMSAGEGWPELCGFLDVPVPDAPFPHSNKRKSA